MLDSFLVIVLLIAVSSFFSLSEISLAAARKIKLKLLADEGNINAQRVLKMQETPGMFFTVVQIGLNAVAILGGIVGDAAFSPAFKALFERFFDAEMAERISFICSFTLVTSLFILFADLFPKRLGMIAPETVALKIINPMRFCLFIFRPLVWFFNGGPISFSVCLKSRWCAKTISPQTIFMPWWKPARWPACCVSRSTN
ncbi:UPF0053 inner membrane protein ytfL [Erwinia amylovora Ea644]|nr:UPF0053 inner membrane protein ytfL [Erwinia amylovora Ea644]